MYSSKHDLYRFEARCANPLTLVRSIKFDLPGSGS